MELFGERGIVGGRGDYGDVFKVLGRGAHHRGAADVDVLDHLGEGRAGAGGGFFKGVEIDDHHVDRLDAVALDSGAMFGVLADVQDAAVDFGMEGLDAAIEHLRKAGELGDVEDGEAGFAKCAGGAAGGDELDTVCGQLAGEVDEACLVGDAEQGAGDSLESGVCVERVCWRVRMGRR